MSKADIEEKMNLAIIAEKEANAELLKAQARLINAQAAELEKKNQG